MEIRCSQCEHLGEAAEVRPVEEGVGLVCAGCGHLNLLSIGPAAAEAPEQREKPKKEPAGVQSLLLARLIPPAGDGPRCRKCAHLVEADDAHCPRCGLSSVEGARLAAGEAPWEQPPPGKEGPFEQARLLWESALERGDASAISTFVDVVLEEGFVDFGIRRLQHFLVENQDHEEALLGLQRLARRLEATLTVAQTRATEEAKGFSEGLERFRARLLLVAVVVWFAILLLLYLVF
jgi:hypothetical protein